MAEVRAGKTRFSPAPNDPDGLAQFQATAKALVFAKSEGFIESCFPHQTAQSGEWLYDLVVVSGGLSHKGEEFLSSAGQSHQAKPHEDILELKPNFMGFGINLNAAWRRLFRRSGPRA